MSTDAQHDDYGPAPGDLELVRRFVNTLDVDGGTEALATPRDLASWLEANGFDAGDDVGEEDRVRAVAFRERLRELLLANNEGAAPAAATVAALSEAAERAGARFGVDEAGGVVLRPVASGVDGLVAGLLAAIARGQTEGTWPRLKACPEESCNWAFYDESRNSSRTWCSMGVCGNRAKTRRYRRRRRDAAQRG